MQLSQLSLLVEMGKVTTCPKCGAGPMSKTHFWRNGAWQCSPTMAARAAGGTKTPATPPAVTPPKAAPVKNVAPAAKTPPVAKPAAAPAPTPAPTAPAPKSSGKSPHTAETFLKQFAPTATKNAQGRYDVIGEVEIDGHWRGDKLPVQFGNVDGDFSMSATLINSLEGAPQDVTGDFFAISNEFKTAVGGPTRVGGSAYYAHCPLASLEGLPSEVSYASEGGYLNLAETQLTSLQGIHKIVKSIDGILDCSKAPIVSNVLGVMYIRKLKSVVFENSKVAEIVNKHLAGERDANECQEELIDAGFAAFAKL